MYQKQSSKVPNVILKFTKINLIVKILLLIHLAKKTKKIPNMWIDETVWDKASVIISGICSKFTD